MSEELKPCPVCGGTIIGFWEDKVFTHVVCGVCNTTGPMGDNDEEAAKAWNTREEPKP